MGVGNQRGRGQGPQLLRSLLIDFSQQFLNFFCLLCCIRSPVCFFSSGSAQCVGFNSKCTLNFWPASRDLGVVILVGNVRVERAQGSSFLNVRCCLGVGISQDLLAVGRQPNGLFFLVPEGWQVLLAFSWRFYLCFLSRGGVCVHWRGMLL